MPKSIHCSAEFRYSNEESFPLIMSRYLSPGKICLLYLIELYRYGEVQNKNVVVILSFIFSHIVHDLQSRDTTTSTSESLSIRSINDFQKLLSSLPSRFPGRSLFDVFLKLLWDLQSLEQLSSLFEKVSLTTILSFRRKKLISAGHAIRERPDSGRNINKLFQSYRPISSAMQPRIHSSSIH